VEAVSNSLERTKERRGSDLDHEETIKNDFFFQGI
jgi:hypothetical protein